MNDHTDNRKRSTVGKRFQAGLTLLNDVDSSAKRFMEFLSSVLGPEERRLSFTYGRPEGSCSGLTLMYFAINTGRAR